MRRHETTRPRLCAPTEGDLIRFVGDDEDGDVWGGRIQSLHHCVNRSESKRHEVTLSLARSAIFSRIFGVSTLKIQKNLQIWYIL